MDWETADWRRIDDLYASFLDLEPAAQQARLSELRQQSPRTAMRLEALLDADRMASRFLEAPASALVTAAGEPMPAGRRVGPYRLERHLGAGGMGTVYLARHEDERLDRQVALKLIRATDRGDLEFQRHFERECRILSSLEHPGIARLYDGGTSADGVAYFVLEYVDGLPLDVYCREHQLGTAQIVALVLPICDAVAYAHSQLVVHRDIKASNVLVNQAGDPKLLDFGIASSLTADPNDAPVAGEYQPHTPAYAAPEQIRGLAPSPATDVYALGVLLYRLLTGSLPHDPSGKPPKEHEQAVLHEVPAPASRAVLVAGPGGTWSPRERARRARMLTGDLDAILARALAKTPTDRYPTAAALAADLRRFREFRPVAARPDTAWYVASRFVRRYRVQVAAAGLVTAALATTAVATTLQARRIAVERDRAVAAQQRSEQERERAERTAALVTEIFEDVDTSGGQDAELSLDDVLFRVRRNLLAYREQGATKAAALISLAEVHHDLGRLDLAESLLDAAVELTSRAPNGSAEALERVRADVVRSEVSLARGRFDHAEAKARSALGELATLPNPPPGLVALAQNNLAVALMALDRPEEAETYFVAAIALSEANPEITKVSFANTLHNYGELAAQTGKLDAARERLERALEVSYATTGEKSQGAARTLASLGTILVQLERFEEAAAAQRKAVAALEEIFGPNHIQVLDSMNNLAVGLRRSGQLGEAAELHCRGLQRRREAFGVESLPVAISLQNLAWVVAELGDPNLAQALLARAETITRQAQAGPTAEGAVLASQGVLASLTGALDRGRELLTRAITLVTPVLGEHHPTLADYQASLAWLELEAGRPEVAAGLAEAAHQVFAESLGPNAPRTSWAEILRAGTKVRGPGQNAASQERIAIAFPHLAREYRNPTNPTLRRAARVYQRATGPAPWAPAMDPWRTALAPPRRTGPLPQPCEEALDLISNSLIPPRPGNRNS